MLFPHLLTRSQANPILDILYRDMYPAVLPTPWMIPGFWDSDHWKDKPYYKHFMDHKVYLFIEKERGHLYTTLNKNVVFENQSCLIVDSDKTVRDGINIQNNSIDFDIYTQTVKNYVM